MKNRADLELSNFLLDRIEEELDDYIFYFKINAAAIEKSFSIGNVHITFFSEEKLAHEKELFIKSDHHEAEFDVLFLPFKKVPLAVYRTKAIKSKARKIAVREVSLAVQALKACLLQESCALHYQMLEVEIANLEVGIASFLYETSNTDQFDFISCLAQPKGAHPIIINRPRLDRLQQQGLKKLSGFIGHKTELESHYAVARAIQTQGDISSTRNLHERTTKIISLFESLIIPENSPKAKGLTLIKSNVLPALKLDPSIQYDRIFNRAYDIRNKYLHNGIELPIDLRDLFELQKCSLMFVFLLCDLSKDYDTLAEIQQHLMPGMS